MYKKAFYKGKSGKEIEDLAKKQGFNPGAQLMTTGNITHSTKVGSKGCTFFRSEKNN